MKIDRNWIKKTLLVILIIIRILISIFLLMYLINSIALFNESIYYYPGPGKLMKINYNYKSGENVELNINCSGDNKN